MPVDGKIDRSAVQECSLRKIKRQLAKKLKSYAAAAHSNRFLACCAFAPCWRQSATRARGTGRIGAQAQHNLHLPCKAFRFQRYGHLSQPWINSSQSACRVSPRARTIHRGRARLSSSGQPFKAMIRLCTSQYSKQHKRTHEAYKLTMPISFDKKP